MTEDSAAQAVIDTSAKAYYFDRLVEKYGLAHIIAILEVKMVQTTHSDFLVGQLKAASTTSGSFNPNVLVVSLDTALTLVREAAKTQAAPADTIMGDASTRKDEAGSSDGAIANRLPSPATVSPDGDGDITLGDPECKKCWGMGYTSEGTPNMYERGSKRTASLCACAIERGALKHPASLSKEAQIASLNQHAAPVDAQDGGGHSDWQKVMEALRFYADPNDYVEPYTGGMGRLYFDCGQKAKEALAICQRNFGKE